jgi:hypothetical protein
MKEAMIMAGNLLMGEMCLFEGRKICLSVPR